MNTDRQTVHGWSRFFRRRLTASATGGLLLALAVGCQSDGRDAETNPSPGSSQGEFEDDLSASSMSATPYDTLRDWVSYSDVAAIVTVTDEEVQRSDDDVPGTTLEGRVLTVRVDEILWHHPESPQLPDQFSFIGAPWIVRDGEKTRLTEEGAAWPEVGGRYMIPFTYYSSSGAWAALYDSTVFAMDDQNRIDIAQSDLIAARDLRGQSAEAISRTLGQTPPDPIAERYRDLDPDSQYEAVVQAAGPVTTPPRTVD